MTVPITAILVAYQRIEQTLATLQKIQACRPIPDEILVYVDGNQTECERAVRRHFPHLTVLLSRECAGPGGGRNQLIEKARNEIVASFDDDSYPHDPDFFARIIQATEVLPGAAVYAASIYHRGEPLPDESSPNTRQADFIGCGAVYRRSWFLKAGGYVPLPVAYGMEEVDLTLRLHGLGQCVVGVPKLRVFHDTELGHHGEPRITAASIANLALLAYLRYPVSLWPYGAAQCLNRIRWLLKHGRVRGIIRGVGMIPAHLCSHRQYRGRLDRQTVLSFVRLRHQPVPVN